MVDRRLLLNELTREELKLIAPKTVAIFPAGATEQHGPHLPVGTDTFAVEHVARRAAEAVADEVPVVVTPTLPFGSSHHHLPLGGTMSLGTETYYAAIRDLVASLIVGGFRRVLIVNGHGGNDELLQLVVRDLALKHPVNLASLSYWLPAMADLTALHEGVVSRLPGHAGAFETSLVMALRPELMQQPLPHRDAEEVARLSQQQSGWRLERHGWWQAIDGFGDSPDLADAARGQASLDAVVNVLAGIIRDFSATPLPDSETASGRF